MTAPVRIEAEAWGDLRFATLARILRLTDSDHALIKCARIWSWQTEHFTPEAPTYVVDQDTIESALGTGGAAAMVRARLAEEVPEGFRIKGGTPERIEWLWKRRKASKLGGDATQNKWKAKAGPDEGQVAIECEPDNKRWPGGLVVARPNEGQARAERGPNRGPLTPVLVPEDQILSPSPRAIDSPTYAIARDTWTEVSAARVRLASALGMKNVHPLPDRFGMPSEPRGCRELRDRVREEGDNAATECKRIVENLIAQAREELSVEWLSEKAFTAGGWQTARNWVPQQKPRRAGPRHANEAIGAASPRSDHPVSATLIPINEL